jgi:Na+/proline symporter
MHYAVRAWPWVLVAVASLVLIPHVPAGTHERAAYPLMMQEVLPAGLRGVVVAAFLAAFMSTIDTHLNWGASYLVRDLYRRHAAPHQNERHYLLVARLATAALMTLAAIASRFVGSISGAWEFVWSLGAGLGPVLILRWFWWRINAWSELAALGSSLAVALVLALTPATSDLPVHVKALILVPATLACWLTVTLLTSPVTPEHLRRFHRRVRPGGRWSPVVGPGRLPDRVLTLWIGVDFFAGLGAVFGLGFGLGSLLLLRPAQGAILLTTGAASTVILYLRHGR